MGIHPDALRAACVRGHLGIVQWLLEQDGVDVRGSLCAAFKWACSTGHVAVVKWCVAEGGVNLHADLMASAFNADDALADACASGYLDLARWLVGQGGADIHARDDCAFIKACMCSRVAVARWLVNLDPFYTQWPMFFVGFLKTWSRPRAGWLRSVAWASMACLCGCVRACV